jgi:hypothetical protein
VPANRFADELTKKVKESATGMLKQRIQTIRCPVHYRTARIGPGSADGTFPVQGCCEELVAEVRRRFR